jgi:hypothetical protein
MTLQIWILIAAVFVAVVLTRIGRHRYARRQRILTLAVVAVLVVKYVRNMPTTGHDGLLEAACAAIGGLFGLAMLAVTSVDRDQTDGQIWVKAGIAYLTLWVVLLGARVAFAYSATGWARGDIRNFFISDKLSSSAIAPAFVLMTIGCLVVVTIGLAIRAALASNSQPPAVTAA